MQQQHSAILEENHYYAFGLRIAGISSKRLSDAHSGLPSNKYLNQGEYSEFDEEIGWNDFALRSYDPQVGRFVNVDPYDQFASPYLGMGCDPVNGVDPSGGFSFGPIADLGSNFLNAAGNALISGAVGYGIGYAVGGDEGGKIGTAIGFGASVGSYINWSGVGGLMNGLGIDLNTSNFPPP